MKTGDGIYNMDETATRIYQYVDELSAQKDKPLPTIADISAHLNIAFVAVQNSIFSLSLHGRLLKIGQSTYMSDRHLIGERAKINALMEADMARNGNHQRPVEDVVIRREEGHVDPMEWLEAMAKDKQQLDTSIAVVASIESGDVTYVTETDLAAALFDEPTPDAVVSEPDDYPETDLARQLIDTIEQQLMAKFVKNAKFELDEQARLYQEEIDRLNDELKSSKTDQAERKKLEAQIEAKDNELNRVNRAMRVFLEVWTADGIQFRNTQAMAKVISALQAAGFLKEEQVMAS